MTNEDPAPIIPEQYQQYVWQGIAVAKAGAIATWQGLGFLLRWSCVLVFGFVCALAIFAALTAVTQVGVQALLKKKGKQHYLD